MRITDIVTKVNCQYGAPMGRGNVGHKPFGNAKKVYDKRVHLNEGYDIGGAYWGIPSNLYVRFTKDLSYVEYFRK